MKSNSLGVIVVGKNLYPASLAGVVVSRPADVCSSSAREVFVPFYPRAVGISSILLAAATLVVYSSYLTTIL